MKKFIVFILFLCFAFLSCENKHISRNVYGRSFDNLEYAVTDIYYQLEPYDLNIPLNEWITLYAETDTIIIIQKMAHKFLNEKSRYVFIFTVIEYPSNSIYRFTIRYDGLKKDF